MPTARQTITEHWGRLPDDVLYNQSFTERTTKTPSSRVKRTILGYLLAETGEGYKYSTTHWTYEHEISEKAAAAIGAQLESAAPVLSAAAKWLAVLRREYPGWVAERGSEPVADRHEWLMLSGLDLARRFGTPADDDDAAPVARASMDERAGPVRGPSGRDVQRYLRQHATELNDLLDATWAEVEAAKPGRSGDPGRVRETDPELMSTLEDFHQAAHLAYVEQWDASAPARETAIRAWERLCAFAAEGAGTEIVTLSSTSPPRRPALRGTRRGESLPLDRSIADRLTRIFRSPATKVRHLDEQPATEPSFRLTTARDFAEQTIVNGVAPFGMREATARALMLAAFRAFSHLGWVPDRRARETLSATYSSPSDQYFLHNWQRVGWHHAHTAGPGTTLGRLIESPAPVMLSRMWARAARTQFQEPEWRPDARMAWDHVRGNFWSIFEEMTSGTTYRQQVGALLEYDDEVTEAPPVTEEGTDPSTQDEWWPTQGAFDTAIEAVLDTGRKLDGFEAVTNFRIATQNGEAWPRATWDAWVSACRHADDEYPSFDQLQQHLMRRLTVTGERVGGRPPSLDDVQALVSFIRSGGGRSVDTVQRFFHRLATGKPPWPKRDVTLWDQWGERFARHQRDFGSQDHVIPTFEHMVALLNDAGVLEALTKETDPRAPDDVAPAGSEY